MSFRKLFASLLIGATAFSCSPVNFNAMQDATPAPEASTPSESKTKPGLLSTLSHLTQAQRIVSEGFVIGGNIKVLCPECEKVTINGHHYIKYLTTLGKKIHCPCCGKGLNIENFAPIDENPETKKDFSNFKKDLKCLTTLKGKLNRLGTSILYHRVGILFSTVPIAVGALGVGFAVKNGKEAKKANAELANLQSKKLKQEVKDSTSSPAVKN